MIKQNQFNIIRAIGLLLLASLVLSACFSVQPDKKSGTSSSTGNIYINGGCAVVGPDVTP